MGKILVLDLGTTYFKATLFDEQGKLVALDRIAPPIRQPAPRQWELDVPAFRETIRQAIDHLRRQSGGSLSEVAAIVFSTQTNTFAVFDENDQPLTPFILWTDPRAAEMDARRKSLDSPELQSKTGVPALTPRFPGAKLLWIQDHQPDIWKRTRRFCLISDYLTLWLTGQHVTEGGAMGLSGLIDIHQLKWWPEMCQRTGLNPSQLPQIARAGADLGPILPDIAADLGLPPTCRFVVGCLDQYAGAIGAGNISPGECLGNHRHRPGRRPMLGPLSSGCHPDPVSRPHLCPRPLLPHGPQPNLRRPARMVSQSTPRPPRLRHAIAIGRPGSPRCPRLTLDRRRPPREHRNRVCRRFQPETRKGSGNSDCPRPPRPERGLAVRCIMETVAAALADQVHQLDPDHKPAEIHSTGGAARSDLWLQIKADTLDVPFLANACEEPTSLGAALLVATALGWGTLPSLASRWIAPRSRFTPRQTGPKP